MNRRVLAAVAMMLGACAPALPPRESLPAPRAARFAGASSSAASVAEIDWATFFADDRLVALVSEALAHNLELRIAVQRIAVARATVLGVTSGDIPEVSGVVSASLSKVGRYTPEGAGNAATEIVPGQRVPTHIADLFVGLQASWEPDLWNRLGRLRGRARARFLASVAGAQLVRSNLVADVAVGYFELLALDETTRVLAEAVTRQTQAVQMMRDEKQAGRTSELSVQQFEAELADVRAMQASTRERTRAVEDELCVLLGSEPRMLSRTGARLYADVGSTMSAGVPGDLLRNRPDVRAAELEVEAARFDTDAARAAFLPRISISASIGYESFDPRYLLRTPASLAYNLLGGLVAPLINRRAIRSAFSAATATERAALYDYQLTVLRSVADVSTGLARLAERAVIVERRREKRTALADAVEAADALFRAGKATYLDVLLAQRENLQAELELIASLRDHHVAAVALYKALGGGWR